MSDENKFFRFVWRVNALVLLLALVGGGGWAAWQSYKLAHEARTDILFMPEQKGPSAFSLQAADPSGVFSSGMPERLYYLVENDTGAQDHATTRNILALNDKAKTSHWLFAQGKRAILDESMVYKFAKRTADAEEGGGYGFAALAIVVVENDTNRDGRFDAKDRQSLYITRLDGKAPVKLLTADRIVLETAIFQQNVQRLIAQDDGKSFEITYSVPDLEVVAKIPLPGLPNLDKPGKAGPSKIGFTGVTRVAD
jgi:hypothetical protein